MSETKAAFVPRLQFDFSDRSLFGDDAAEQEKERLFSAFAVERPELGALLDHEESIRVVRAYKGEGKSALLRLLRTRLAAQDPDVLIVSAIGPDISPDLDSTESDVWTRAWKRKILQIVASEIGTGLDLAFTDDAMSLVEEAEANGFKKKSLFSAIFERLKLKYGEVEIERKRLGVSDFEQVVKRWSSGRPLMWVIVDDIDQNYKSVEKHQVKIQSCFLACRQIVAKIPELRFRLAIRPNVWAQIKRDFEAMSHLEQYVLDVQWNEHQYRTLIAKRIRAYLERTNQWERVRKTLPIEESFREKSIIALAFEDPMPWGGGEKRRPPHVVLHTLSCHRPRWLIELCREAAFAAYRRGGSKIGYDDITSTLQAFGTRRLEDTEAEYKSECPQIRELIDAFSRQYSLFRTDELLKTIQNRILQAVHPRISSVPGAPNPVDVAHLLFRVGFLSARRDFGDGDYEHVTYSQKPSLLSSRTNLDDGLTWEIHPVFRDVLQLRKSPVRDRR